MIKTIVFNGAVANIDTILLKDFIQGFSFGAGLFETFLIEAGIPLLLDRHLARLQHSLAQLETFVATPTPELLQIDRLQQMLNQALAADAELGQKFTGIGKIIVSDGQLLITFRHLPPHHESRLADGLDLAQTVDHLYRKGDMTINHKSLNYFRQYMFLRQNVIFVNEMQEICETPTTNIFLEIDDAIITPPLNAPCLPGTIRGVLLSENVLPNLREGDLSLRDLDRVRGGFCTNSVSIAMPIATLLGKKLETSHTLAQSVRKAIRKTYLTAKH